MSAALKKAGALVTIEQLAVRDILVSNEKPMTMSELSLGVFKVNANITRIVDKLEQKELVERFARKSDRRSLKVMATKKGELEFHRMLPIIMQTQREYGKTITDEEKKELLRIVKKIIDANT